MALAIAFAGVGLAAVLVLLSLGGSANSAELRAWALVVFAIALFATHVLPEHVTALSIMLLAIVGGVAPSSVVFSGFQVGALWLLFGGIIIGQAVQEAGLGVFLAKRVLGLWRLTYPRAIVLLVVVAALLGFAVPATIPRVILLMPLALGMAEAMGLKAGGRGYVGLAIGVGAGTFFPGFAIITANLPSVVHVGAIEAIYGLTVSYGAFLVYHFPLGLFRAVILIVLLIVLFREPARAIVEIDEERMTGTQKRLLGVLLGALVLWGTDVVHGIQPAWIAMATAIVILWPAANLISKNAFRDRMSFAPVLYIAGILSIGAIMIHNGLDERVGAFVLRLLDGGGAVGGIANFYLVTLLSMGVSLVTTAPAASALLVPVAADIGQATGLPLPGVLMTELVGFSTVLLPYQAPPLVVMLGLSQVRAFDLAKVCILVAAATLTIGVPLTFLWWRLIGLL